MIEVEIVAETETEPAKSWRFPPQRTAENSCLRRDHSDKPISFGRAQASAAFSSVGIRSRTHQ